MSAEISFTLGAPTKTLNELRGMHHRVYAKHRAAVAQEVLALTVGKRPPQPFAKARLVVERHSAGRPDVDGLYGGLKPLLDVLQPYSKRCPNGLGIIANDAPGALELKLLTVICPPGQGKTVVEIHEVKD
jgi:hypothetical protein